MGTPQVLRPVELGLPGPTNRDMARAFGPARRDPLSYLGGLVEEHGDLVAFPVPRTAALLVNDPDAVRHVLQGNARNWGKQTVQYAALARVTGQGLLASAAPDWIEDRRLAAPAFHHHRLAAVSDQVREAADRALGDALARTSSGAVVDVAALVHRVGLDAVGRALFSADVTEHAQQLLRATGEAAELIVRLTRSPLSALSWAPTPTNRALARTRRRLDDTAARIVAERRARGRSGEGHHGDDLLGLLLDSGMPDHGIRDELVTMVIAGHETVAGALTWTLMLLAEHPGAQDRLRAELAAHDGPVTMLDHRERLPWTRAVVDEALRLFPPAWALSRRSHGPDELAGVEVPAGTTVILSPWLLHRRGDTWPEPLSFRPERFLDAGAGRTAYVPFGLGPRLCIGREFALGEMLVVLSRVLADHRVATPPGYRRPVPEVAISVHPRGGLPLVLERAGA